MGKFEDLTGRRFGRLYVLKREGTHVSPGGSKKALWLCVCDCGNLTTTRTRELKGGHTQSCGCLQRERTSMASKKHGMRHERLYHSWIDMKQRCQNPNNSRYDDWGGRGIEVCPEWRDSFEAFRDWALANGYRDDLTIERKDVNGHYCPENCCWITKEQQQRNKRNNRIITYNGKTQTLQQWADELGMHETTLLYRLKKEWTLEKALTQPVRKRKEK